MGKRVQQGGFRRADRADRAEWQKGQHGRFNLDLACPRLGWGHLSVQSPLLRQQDGRAGEQPTCLPRSSPCSIPFHRRPSPVSSSNLRPTFYLHYHPTGEGRSHDNICCRKGYSSSVYHMPHAARPPRSEAPRLASEPTPQRACIVGLPDEPQLVRPGEVVLGAAS